MVHAHIGDIQGAQQIPQCRHVGAGDLRGTLPRPLDGFGDDLDQRHTGTVVVEQRLGGAGDPARLATDVGQLAGVLFHVRTLDMHPPRGAVFQRNIEVAVERDRLVVLGDLIVLRLIRVEIVLAGEPAPGSDLAVQRQTDPDGRFDGLFVDDRQRARQTQADGANLGIGFRTEGGRATTEHLGGRGQFDVNLHTEHRLVSGQHVVVVQQFCHAAILIGRLEWPNRHVMRRNSR
ncbi:Uncharacterised protein [Mycobacteroides abscessus subsp. massiliense]|nr:Uncharacterised protein [Mycobacteroides abscessus subsp. massiliense]